MDVKKKRKLKLIQFICLFILIFIAVSGESSANKDSDTLDCHGTGYTISVNATTIQSDPSAIIYLEVNATGAGVVIDVYATALDNEEFIVSPSNIIADGDSEDLDTSADSMRVILQITLPETVADYDLRILSREAVLSGGGTSSAVADIEVTIGDVEITLWERILNHYNLYIGGLAIVFIILGTVVFQITVNKRGESKLHGPFFGLSLILTTINIFLILDDTMVFAFGDIDLAKAFDLARLNHIIIGIIGLIASIIVVFGTYTKLRSKKMKIAVYIMLVTCTFNFLNGILSLTSNYGLGG